MANPRITRRGGKISWFGYKRRLRGELDSLAFSTCFSKGKVSSRIRNPNWHCLSHKALPQWTDIQKHQRILPVPRLDDDNENVLEESVVTSKRPSPRSKQSDPGAMLASLLSEPGTDENESSDAGNIPFWRKACGEDMHMTEEEWGDFWNDSDVTGASSNASLSNFVSTSQSQQETAVILPVAGPESDIITTIEVEEPSVESRVQLDLSS